MSSLIEYDSNSPLDSDPLSTFGEGAEVEAQTNVLALAWQARWLILLTVLTGVGVSWQWLQRVVPRYTSESQIYIKRSLPKVLSGNLQMGSSASYLYTQAALIRSSKVLLAVAQSPENAQLETFSKSTNPVGLLKNKLDVQVGKDNDIIYVRIELPIAEDAAQIVNSVVKAYTSKYSEDHRKGTVKILNILREEKRRRDAELEQKHSELAEFRRQNSTLVVRSGRENLITSRFASLAKALDLTELELINSKARYNHTQQLLKSPDQRPYLFELASGRSSTSVDLRIDNQLQIDLEKQILATEQSISSLRATWGNGYTRVKLLNESKEKLQKRLADKQVEIEERKTAIISAYVETVTQKYRLLEQKLAELQSKYDAQYKLAMQVNLHAVQLDTLKELVERATMQANSLNGQINQLNLSENVGAMNVSVLEDARTSSSPSYPVHSRFLAIGALLGGLVGFGLAWLRSLLDHRIKSTEEITRALLLPVLEALPLAGGRLSRAQVGSIMVLQPQAMLSEAFRSLRTSIYYGATGNKSKIISITSALSEEGKSVVASNLAIALAQLGRKVLLIDADFRRSCQNEIFDIETDRGLSTVLSESLSVSDAILPTSVPQLDLLPSGPTASNPVDLLNSGYFDDLLDDLGNEYDRIVIDSPAILPVADARVVAALSDTVLLVLQAEKSTIQDSLAARDQLWQVGARQLGVVVTRVPPNKLGAYGRGYEALGQSEPAPPMRRKSKREKALISAE